VKLVTFERAERIMADIKKLREDKKALIANYNSKTPEDVYVRLKMNGDSAHHMQIPLSTPDFIDLMTSHIEAKLEKLEYEFEKL
jgi:hypothetical protein